MNIDSLEANLRTLADMAYRRISAASADDTEATTEATVLAETLQSIAIGLSTAIRQLTQEAAELRRRIEP